MACESSFALLLSKSVCALLESVLSSLRPTYTVVPERFPWLPILRLVGSVLRSSLQWLAGSNADDHGKFLVPVSKEAGVPSVNKLLYPLHSIRDIVAAGVVHAAATNFYSYE